MSARSVLLRLSNDGEPVQNSVVQNGVLILPSLPLLEGYKKGDALFELIFSVNAASNITRNGVLLTNIPKDSDSEFERQKFHEYPFESSFHKDILLPVSIYRQGAFCFYISYENESQERVETEKYYLNVPPNLMLDDKYVPFNNINIETIVPKFAGALDLWEDLFAEVSKKGYNMVHFTPIQQRGISDSPFSIYDQLRFDPNLFKDNKHAIEFIHSLLKRNNLLSLTDVVWNHTANNSEWIRDYPEAGYNVETAPHLTSAIELDEELQKFSLKLADFNLPSSINSLDDLDAVIQGISEHVLQPLNLWQYYVFNKTEILEEISKKYYDPNLHLSPIEVPSDLNTEDIHQLSEYVLKTAAIDNAPFLKGRFENELDTEKILGVLLYLLGKDYHKFETIKDKANSIVDEINLSLYKAYDVDIQVIKTQLKDRIRYLRLDSDGPQLGPITSESPLTEVYFTRFTDNKGKEWALANNGWIWGEDPLVDFASSASKAYLRREVIVWGDCIKLRYGSKYEDSPHLWDRMIEYTKLCASVFDGFRIDNCHSTPLHVGEKLLDAARSVNPNLYVVAELFSGSEEKDKIFVERLGINSLIREAMQAWNVAELSRLVHKHGGRPIGSLTWMPLNDFAFPASGEPNDKKYEDSFTEIEIPRVLSSQLPHALFMDCTHDNQTPAQKRTVEDTLPNAALVAFCSSAIGSVFGYDEGYPKLLDLVSEKRHYTYNENGIGPVKTKLHAIRQSLATESEEPGIDNEMFIHHEDQYITIQRYNSRTGRGWFLIARSKFNSYNPDQILSPVTLNGTSVKYEFAYSLEKTGEHEEHEDILTSIPTKIKELPSPKVVYDGTNSVIEIDNTFAPGSIAVFSTSIPNVDKSLDDFVRKGALEASSDLDLYDLNSVLYRAEPEERDVSDGLDGVYDIPGYGPLVYAGFEGWISVLKDVIWNNDLAHPICNHLRDGEWALDYVVRRLDKYSNGSNGLKRFQEWLKTRIDAIRVVPYFLRPHYFALVISVAYEAARFRSLSQLGSNTKDATNFIQSLALTSVQMVSRMNSSSLKAFEKVPCIAAGLPHFSSNYMRCWGRDVFISFRGMFIATERYEDAKAHILGFAQTLKHGLIPNLLDSGRNPRYNARDAVWFFCEAIQDYVKYAHDGISILDEKVKRRFPLDDAYVEYNDPIAFSYESSIRDILFEVLQRHARGIKYREANAGPNLDSQMSEEGFNVEVNIDWSTGFVHGGSQFNCGTWMDKMGESVKAGSKGVPGTPRDGAAVELQGLLKSTLRFVNKLHELNKFPYSEVTRADGSSINLKDWEDLILKNFEKHFYIPTNPADDSNFVIDQNLVNRRGIYKDLYKTGKPYEDYQLRANFPIAMVVAPELFTPSRALEALHMADKIIRGKVGMRTLDPSDWNYRPYYNNGEDSEDFATSKGRNYHQGPEWVWLYGFFMRAFCNFSFLQDERSKTESGEPSANLFIALNERIYEHMVWIRQSPWAGLAELTNKDGAFCPDSCASQAWSSSCLLDLYHDLWTKHISI